METIFNFLSEQNWYVVAIAIFVFLGHIINGAIIALDALEELLKKLGKPASWIDKVTNVLAVVAGWINKILNFANANKKK